ncbi:MAG: hypothetical protein AAGH79_06000 [Bacteroidota bacterium]
MKKVHQSLLPILLQESGFFHSDQDLLETIQQKLMASEALGLFQNAEKNAPIDLGPYHTIHPWQMQFERRKVQVQLLHCQYRDRWEIQDIQLAA